jgi:DNA-binding transcriptional MerR regulator
MLTELQATRFYETSDVARALDVADATIRLWERGGRIAPPGRTPGGRRIFTEQQLATIREQHNARRAARAAERAVCSAA